MTAKQKLRERIEKLTGQEGAEALRLLDQRNDPLAMLLGNAPLDDEPSTDDEEAAVRRSR
jgi:hypothetical protein